MFHSVVVASAAAAAAAINTVRVNLRAYDLVLWHTTERALSWNVYQSKQVRDEAERLFHETLLDTYYNNKKNGDDTKVVPYESVHLSGVTNVVAAETGDSTTLECSYGGVVVFAAPSSSSTNNIIPTEQDLMTLFQSVAIPQLKEALILLDPDEFGNGWLTNVDLLVIDAFPTPPPTTTTMPPTSPPPPTAAPFVINSVESASRSGSSSSSSSFPLIAGILVGLAILIAVLAGFILRRSRRAHERWKRAKDMEHTSDFIDLEQQPPSYLEDEIATQAMMGPAKADAGAVMTTTTTTSHRAMSPMIMAAAMAAKNENEEDEEPIEKFEDETIVNDDNDEDDDDSYNSGGSQSRIGRLFSKLGRLTSIKEESIPSSPSSSSTTPRSATTKILEPTASSYDDALNGNSFETVALSLSSSFSTTGGMSDGAAVGDEDGGVAGAGAGGTPGLTSLTSTSQSQEDDDDDDDTDNSSFDDMTVETGMRTITPKLIPVHQVESFERARVAREQTLRKDVLTLHGTEPHPTSWAHYIARFLSPPPLMSLPSSAAGAGGGTGMSGSSSDDDEEDDLQMLTPQQHHQLQTMGFFKKSALKPTDSSAMALQTGDASSDAGASLTILGRAMSDDDDDEEEYDADADWEFDDNESDAVNSGNSNNKNTSNSNNSDDDDDDGSGEFKTPPRRNRKILRKQKRKSGGGGGGWTMTTSCNNKASAAAGGGGGGVRTIPGVDPKTLGETMEI